MKLKTFKQTTYEGCFVISLLNLAGIKASKKKELEIIINSLKKRRDNYYAYNILSSFTEIYNLKAVLYVDAKPYALYLNKRNKNKEVTILHHKIDKDFLSQQKNPFIVQVDDYVLGDIIHASHYIIIEEQNKNTVIINDPWYGKKSKIKVEVLLEAIESLEKTFLYSPLLITLNKKY